jgi:predicted nucleic acid-binding protein
MKPVFADTSYYLALVNASDPRHERAVELAESVLGRVFVTEHVLLELGSALSRGPDRLVFLELLEDLLSDDSTTLISAGKSLFAEGVALFAKRPDKEWSLVDCISFVAMKQHRLVEALTTDHHFVQAGFRALLREGGPAP